MLSWIALGLAFGHWFMMQIGMIAGYFTAWPVNRLRIRAGMKEKMDHRSQLAALVERRQVEQTQGRGGAGRVRAA